MSVKENNNPGGLSKGQLRVLRKRVEGFSFDKIAQDSNATPKTRRNELTQVYRTLGTHSLVGTVQELVRRGAKPGDFLTPQQLQKFEESFSRLTPAEQDVLKHMVNNPASKVVARERGTSRRTTRHQQGDIAEKLGLPPHAAAAWLYLSEQQKSSETSQQQNP